MGFKPQSPKSTSTTRPGTSTPRRPKASTKQQETKTVNVLESIIKTRKAWKTIRGGEVVWPPELEEALLQGLAKYQPDDSRETRLLGRFPMRNRFISDHIFEVTGVRRTAKQVGSRLQQLRDTYHNTDLMKLLLPLGPVSASARRRMSFADSSSSSSSSSSDSSPPSSPQTPLDDFSSFPSHTTIHIDIIDPKASPLAEPMALPLSDENVIRTSSKARPIQEIDPTVTFIAPTSVSALSSYAVYIGDQLVYSETNELAPCGRAPGDSNGKYLYRSPIVPGFWKRIVESSDPTQYTIVQEVYPADGPSDSPSIFSSVYKFNYPPSAADFIDAAFSDSGLDAPEPSSPLDPLSTLPMDTLITMDPSFNESVYETYCDFLALSDRSWTSSPSQASVDFAWGYDERAVSIGPSSMSPPAVSYSPMLSEYVHADVCDMS